MDMFASVLYHAVFLWLLGKQENERSDRSRAKKTEKKIMTARRGSDRVVVRDRKLHGRLCGKVDKFTWGRRRSTPLQQLFGSVHSERGAVHRPMLSYGRRKWRRRAPW